MSILDDPITKTEQAGEKILKQAETDAPDTFAAILRKCLDVMTEYEFSFGSIGLRKRQ